MFLVTSKEKHNCPACGKELTGHGTKKRHNKDENGDKVWYQIPRKECKKCKKTHIMLPDFMIPYKHYRAEIIEAVIDGTDIYFAIEESTIYRWKRWFRNIKEQLNSNLRAVRQAEEGLFYTLLGNTSSLLEEIRQSGGKWLAKAIGITINAGYPAYTQFAYSPSFICGRLDTS